MFGSLTCRNGHTWAPDSVPASFGEDRCPRCGAPSRSPDVVGRRAWITLGVVEAILVAAMVAAIITRLLFGWRPPFPVAVMMVGLPVFLLPTLALLLTLQRARTRGMEVVCRAMGLAFTGQLSPARLKALGPFQALRPGKVAAAFHLMEGEWDGHGVALLELREHGRGDENPQNNHTAVIVRGPTPPAGLPGRAVARHFRARRATATAVRRADRGDRVPPPGAVPGVSVGELALRLEPVGPGGWLRWRLGWLQTPFPHHPAFAAAYRLQGPCGAAVRRALRREVLDVFAAYPGWHVEVRGGRLLAHRPGPCDPAECPRLIAEAVRMHRALLRAWAESQNG
jgi:hypothetical protein